MCGKYGCKQLLSCCSSSAVYVWEILMQAIVELLFFQCCLCVGNMDANNC